MKLYFTKKYLTLIISCISIIFCSSFSQATQDEDAGKQKTLVKGTSLHFKSRSDSGSRDDSYKHKDSPKNSERPMSRSQDKSVLNLAPGDLRVEGAFKNNSVPENQRGHKKKMSYKDLENSHERQKKENTRLKASNEKWKKKCSELMVSYETWVARSKEELAPLKGLPSLDLWQISQNKIALVTGSTRGIGKALTEALLASGIDVIGVARNQKALESFAAHQNEKKSTLAALGNFKGIIADLSSQKGQDLVAPYVTSLLSNNRKLDYIVFNAAIITPLGYEVLFTSSEDEIRNSIETNLLSPIILTNTLYSLSGDDARTLIISSVAGDRPGGGTLLYSTTKAAVDRVVGCLRKDQGLRAGSPLLNDLWKNRLFASVNPGNVETDIHSVDLRGANPEAFPRVEYFKKMEGQLTPPEVAAEYIKWLLIEATREQFLEYEKHSIYNSKQQEYWTPGKPVLDPYAIVTTPSLSASSSLSTTSSVSLSSSSELSPLTPRMTTTTRSPSSTDLGSIEADSGEEY